MALDAAALASNWQFAGWALQELLYIAARSYWAECWPL